MGKYDIFISYRREGGVDKPRQVYLALKEEHYKKIFFDHNSLGNGEFPVEIEKAIKGCKDFILILSDESMDRCSDSGDFVATEIRAALEAGCNIIPVECEDFHNNFPGDFPDDIIKVKNIQRVQLRTGSFFDASIKMLVDRLKTVRIINGAEGKLISKVEGSKIITTKVTEQIVNVGEKAVERAGKVMTGGTEMAKNLVGKIGALRKKK